MELVLVVFLYTMEIIIQENHTVMVSNIAAPSEESQIKLPTEWNNVMNQTSVTFGNHLGQCIVFINSCALSCRYTHVKGGNLIHLSIKLYPTWLILVIENFENGNSIML